MPITLTQRALLFHANPDDDQSRPEHRLSNLSDQDLTFNSNPDANWVNHDHEE